MRGCHDVNDLTIACEIFCIPWRWNEARNDERAGIFRDVEKLSDCISAITFFWCCTCCTREVILTSVCLYFLIVVHSLCRVTLSLEIFPRASSPPTSPLITSHIPTEPSPHTPTYLLQPAPDPALHMHLHALACAAAEYSGAASAAVCCATSLPRSW
jgi:hypothetical protein